MFILGVLVGIPIGALLLAVGATLWLHAQLERANDNAAAEDAL